MSLVNHGRFGLRSGIRLFSDWIDETDAKRQVLAKAKPGVVVDEWSLDSGNTYVAPVAITFDGVKRDIVGVTSLIDAALTRAESLADCQGTAGTYYYDPAELDSGERWDDGVTVWDPQILSDGLVGWWKGDDETDSSGNGNDLNQDVGTGATYTAGLSGNAITTTAANASYRNSADLSVINALGAGSFAWGQKFKVTGGSGSRFMIRMGAASTAAPGFKAWITSAGALSVDISGNSTDPMGTGQIYGSNLDDGNWHSYFVSVDRGDDNIRVFIDGEIVATVSCSGMGSVSNASQNFGIGCSPDSGSLLFVGQLDQNAIWGSDAAIWNQDGLTNAQAATLAAETYHAGVLGEDAAAVPLSLTGYDDPVLWDSVPKLYVHLSDNSNPNNTTVVALLGFYFSLFDQTHPELGPELLPNNQFDTWTTSTDPADWLDFETGTGWQVYQDSTDVLHGTYSARIDVGTAAGSVTLYYNHLIADEGVPIVGGGWYRYSGWYKTSAGLQSDAFVEVQAGRNTVDDFAVDTDGRSTKVNAYPALAHTNGEWRRFTFDFICPTAEVSDGIQLRLRTSGTPTTPGESLWVDSLSLRRIWRFPLWEGRISTRAIPSSSTGSNDVYFGGKRIGTGRIGIENTDGYADRLLGQFDWINREVEVYVGGVFSDESTLPFEDYRRAFTGQIQRLASDDSEASFDIQDSRLFFHVKLPPNTYPDEGGYETRIIGKPRPLWFGAKENVTPNGISIDATSGYRTYELCDCDDAPNGIKAVSSVFAYSSASAAKDEDEDERVTLVEDTDYSVDLANGRITVLRDVQTFRVAEDNQYIDFNDGGSDFAAQVAVGLYASPQTLAAAMKTAMEAVGGQTYTITYSDSTHQFTIASDGATFVLKCQNGTNKDAALWTTIGFSTNANRTGATSYVGDDAVFSEADKSHFLRVNGQGYKDDASGTYTGTASALIQIGADILRALFVIWLKKDATLVDNTSFQFARDRAPESLTLYLNSTEDTKDIFDKLEFSNISNIVVDGAGQISCNVYVGDVPANIVKLYDWDFASFKVERSVREVFTTIKVKYDEDPSNGDMPAVASTESSTSARFGRPEIKEFETYCKITDNAQAVADRMLELAKLPARKFRLRVASGKVIESKVGDKIQITRARALDADGRIKDLTVRIISLDVDYLTGETTIEAVDDVVTVAGVACVTTCQSFCESTCQTGCQIACQSTCENSCQEACEVGCQAGCESVCQTSCELSCQTTCETACQTACQSSCQSGCEGGGCQTACEAGCQTTCELSCQTGCEAACQSGCQLSCQSGCEVNCQTGCEVSCQTACETACQATCELNCQTTCQLFCQSTCQTECQSFSQQEIPL